MSFGSRVKERREQLNMTRRQLAERMGITASAVANYENEISSPKADLLYPLMDALKCDANYLYQDETKALGGYPVSLEYEEHEHIKKYRALDTYGKDAVNSVLDVEYRRCEEDHKTEVAAAKKELERTGREASEEVVVQVTIYSIPYQLHPMSAGTGQEADTVYTENLRLIKEPPYGTSYVARVSGDSMEPTYFDGDLVFVHSTVEIREGQVGVFLMDGQQWIKELGNGVLISHNEAYEPRRMTPDIRCQGLVLGVCDESYF